MKLKLITPKQTFANMIAQGMERMEQHIIRMLCYVGEQCINDGRLRGSYTDRTGNLRSSIGYVVVKDGQIIQLTMNPVTLNGKDGTSNGEAYLRSLVGEYTNGIALIVVAGMKYAAYVEARGYNVISSAELLAETLISQLLK